MTKFRMNAATRDMVEHLGIVIDGVVIEPASIIVDSSMPHSMIQAEPPRRMITSEVPMLQGIYGSDLPKVDAINVGGTEVIIGGRVYRLKSSEDDPDVRIAGITAPFIAELRTGSGRTIRVGKSGVERIRQVVNHEGHVLYHVVDGEGDRQWLVYDGVEAELTRELSGLRGAKRRER